MKKKVFLQGTLIVAIVASVFNVEEGIIRAKKNMVLKLNKKKLVIIERENAFLRVKYAKNKIIWKIYKII